MESTLSAGRAQLRSRATDAVNVSISLEACAAERVNLSRDVPSGTVGGRIAVA